MNHQPGLILASSPERSLRKAVLRLVKGGPERRAITAGQVDAILDPVTGRAFLLPEAQHSLLAREAASPAAPRAVLDALTIAVGVLDSSGVVISSNEAWRARNTSPCLGAGIAEGENFLAACENAPGPDRLDGLAVAAGLRQVLAGERARFRYEHACGLDSGRRWFLFSITPANDGPARALVAWEDISEGKHREQLLEAERAAAYSLVEAADPAAAVTGVIRSLCEGLGWDCGRYFRLDPATSVLRLEQSWGVPTDAVAQFLERSRGVVFRPGTGLKGRVYRSGEPLWIVPGAPRGALPAATLPPERDGDGIFIFPVMAGGGTLGVLAFSGPGIREPDDALLKAARAIGIHLGRTLQQLQALDALRRSEARFRRLTELSADWYWEQDSEFRFTDYVGAGVLDLAAVLSKRLWELPNVLPGSADWETHQSQLGQRWSFCDFEFTAVLADGQAAHFCISGEPVFDDRGAFTGYRGTGRNLSARQPAAQAPELPT